MYKIEPIYSFRENNISLPVCMYKVANIHEQCLNSQTSGESRAANTSIDEQVMRLLQKPSEIAMMIEERQQKLLKQLECLRSQMLRMKQNMLSSQPQSSVSNVVAHQESNLSKDIVITADPKKIPYYLLTLQKVLKLNISCHTHSSVLSVHPSVEEFVKKVHSENATSNEGSVRIVLIWKPVGVGTILTSSSIMPVAICGDVNIMRYLTSVVHCNLTYSHLENAWKVDSTLDICHRLQWHETSKQKQTLLQELSRKLGKSQWLSGDSKYSIEDIGVWSAIKQRDYGKDLAANLKDWYKKCESSF